MGRRHPDLRNSHREGRSFRNRGDRAKAGDFSSQLIAGCIVTAMLGWFAAGPQIAVQSGGQSTPRQDAVQEQSVYYSGCNDARAAGAAPIYQGQPGYRPEMDGDGDGIACEPH